MFVERYGEDGLGGRFANEQAAVNKRKDRRQPKPGRADATAPFAETEPPRPATPPGQRAANGGLP